MRLNDRARHIYSAKENKLLPSTRLGVFWFGHRRESFFRSKEMVKQRNKYIYIVRCNEHFKIGITSNFKARLSQLQSGNPYKLEVLTVLPDTQAPENEKKIHDLLKQNVRSKFTGKVIFEINFAKGGIT